MYIGLGIVFSALFRYHLARENARRDRGERDDIIDADGTSTGDGGANGKFSSVDDAKREKATDGVVSHHRSCVNISSAFLNRCLQSLRRRSRQMKPKRVHKPGINVEALSTP